MSPLPPIVESGSALPPVVMGYVSIRSRGGTSFLDAEDFSDAEPFYAAEGADADADNAIERAGLEVVAESALGRAVAGPPEAYEELTGGTLQPYEQLMRTRTERAEYVTHLDIVGSDQPDDLGVGVARSEAIEGV